MFITKKHISRRTVLRGAGATLALPLLDAMMPAATAAGADRGRRRSRASSAASCRTAWRRATGCRRRKAAASTMLPFNWKPLEPFREADRDPERPALALGRTASGRRPAPTTGWPRRSCARTSRRRPPAPTSTPARPSTRSSRRRSARTTCCRRCSSRSKIRARTRATAAKATAAPTPTRSPGRRRRRRCRWS